MEESEAFSEKRKRHGDMINNTLKMELTQSNDFVNYFSEPPSLQWISAVSITIKMCESEIKKEIISPDQLNVSKTLEAKVLNKLSSSSLPSPLKTEISYVIPPIMSNLLGELSGYCACTGYHKTLCKYMKGRTVHWTVEGTIDITKSFIELLNKENLENDICHLYEAACFYCLEKYISILWQKVPVEVKNQFRTGRIGDVYKHHLVIYWTSVLENNLDCFLNKVIRLDYENIYNRNLSIDLNMITCSIHGGSKFALKYFWKKLTEQEKIANLDNWLLQATTDITRVQSSMCGKYDESFDILCFLLSHVNNRLRLAEYFQNHCEVLTLLLYNWPFQRMFLPTVLELLDCIQEEVYISMMKDIGSNLDEEGIATKMFEEIWNVSPTRLKRSFLIKRVSCAEVLLNFMKVENLSLSRMLLIHSSEEDVKQLLCYMLGWEKFCFFLYRNKLNLVCTLLSETTLPPECNFYTLCFNLEDGLRTSKWLTEWHICNEWLKEGKFQTVEIFFKWAFKSVEEVQGFKRDKLNPYIMYVLFLVKHKYEFLELFLKWFFETEEEIQKFKTNFLNDDSHFKLLLCELCSQPSTASDVLEKFVSNCLPSAEEIMKLKSTSLNYVETALKKRYYEFATVLLKWSLNNIDDVKRYKTDFILSENGIRKFIFLEKLKDVYIDMENLIKWSLPLSRETIAELKSLIQTCEPFYHCESESKLKVMALLDSVEC